MPSFIVSDKVGDALIAGESGTKTSATAFQTNKTVSVASAAKTETLRGDDLDHAFVYRE